MCVQAKKKKTSKPQTRPKNDVFRFFIYSVTGKKAHWCFFLLVAAALPSRPMCIIVLFMTRHRFIPSPLFHVTLFAAPVLFFGMTRRRLIPSPLFSCDKFTACCVFVVPPPPPLRRRRSLNAVYSDFVHTAVTYGRTIISEYFLHEYMKSVK